jgi:hypothetical protein
MIMSINSEATLSELELQVYHIPAVDCGEAISPSCVVRFLKYLNEGW